MVVIYGFCGWIAGMYWYSFRISGGLRGVREGGKAARKYSETHKDEKKKGNKEPLLKREDETTKA